MYHFFHIQEDQPITEGSKETPVYANTIVMQDKISSPALLTNIVHLYNLFHDGDCLSLVDDVREFFGAVFFDPWRRYLTVLLISRFYGVPWCVGSFIGSRDWGFHVLHRMIIAIHLILTINYALSIDKCSELAPKSLGLGQICLSNCNARCNSNVTPPGFLNLPILDLQSFKSDCKDDKQRYICTPTELIPHGYPLCQVINLNYCQYTSCACWTSCMDESCPVGFTLKRNHITNSGGRTLRYRIENTDLYHVCRRSLRGSESKCIDTTFRDKRSTSLFLTVNKPIGCYDSNKRRLCIR